MSGVKAASFFDRFAAESGVGLPEPFAFPRRVDLSSVDVQSGDTDGGVIKAGTSSAPVTEDTANMKFLSFYFDDGATSGEAVGLYDRLYVTGAGAEGIAMRAFCSVVDVAAVNARGTHSSLSFGATGRVSGLGAALEATLHLGTGAGATGTLTAVNAAIDSPDAASDPAGATSLSVIRAANQGSAKDDVDDDAVFIDFAGWTLGAGHMIQTDTGNVDTLIKIRLPDGSLGYLMVTKTIT